MTALHQVLTIAEVASAWGRNERSVRYHINRGNFHWRETVGGVILIDRESVEALWGKDPSGLEIEVHEALIRARRGRKSRYHQ